MRLDEEGKKKIEKTEERITHKIAKDIEKAESKRKAEGEAHQEVLDQVAGESRYPQEEESAKRRTQEDSYHRTAASSSAQAAMDVDSGVAHGGVAVDKTERSRRSRPKTGEERREGRRKNWAGMKIWEEITT